MSLRRYLIFRAGGVYLPYSGVGGLFTAQDDDESILVAACITGLKTTFLIMGFINLNSLAPSHLCYAEPCLGD